MYMYGFFPPLKFSPLHDPLCPTRRHSRPPPHPTHPSPRTFQASAYEVTTPEEYVLEQNPDRSCLNRFFMPNPKVHPRAGKTIWRPEEDASWFSKLHYMYISPLMNLGYVQPLHVRDLPDPNSTDMAAHKAEELRVAMMETKEDPEVNRNPDSSPPYVNPNANRPP